VTAIRGYRLILTMPETMSTERVAILRQLGAEIVLTPGILMTDAVAGAESLANEISGAVRIDQFRNPLNPEIHRRTTAIEIWDDTEGAVDVFVSAVGTGGTITGLGEALKQRRPAMHVVAVEPAGAAVLSGGRPGPTASRESVSASFHRSSTWPSSTRSSRSAMVTPLLEWTRALPAKQPKKSGGGRRR
jgi:cysteine synthase A